MNNSSFLKRKLPEPTRTLADRFIPTGDFAKQQDVPCKNCGHVGSLHLGIAPLHPCTRDACMQYVPATPAPQGVTKGAAAKVTAAKK